MKYLIAVAVLAGLFMAGRVAYEEFESTPRAVGHSTAPISLSSNGEMVDLSAHLSSEGYTVVEFMADW